MHPFISILLTVSFALSGTLAPRYQCLCVDGTVSVEIGQRFCRDSCSSNTAPEEEPCCPPRDTLSRSNNDCKSQLISDEVARLTDRDDEGEPDPPLSMIHPNLTMTTGAHRTQLKSAWCNVRVPICRTTGTSQIRSVILLV